MDAVQAINQLDPQQWQKTSAEQKLKLLRQIQSNLDHYRDELVRADCEMKRLSVNDPVNAHQVGTAIQSTLIPFASNVAACIDIYQGLLRGEMPKPLKVIPVGNDLYDIQVFPIQSKDKFLYLDRKDYLRVKGLPVQVNPLEKPEGIIAVLCAGNYSSPFEVIRALFVDNKAVVYKPHYMNIKSSAVWEKILSPLVEYSALSFCGDDQGEVLVKDKRLTKIYFIGSTEIAQAIMAATKTEVVSECGGNNPCIIVPGDSPWTEKQLRHHAIMIATGGKVNGGAVCGRIQTVITCKNWPQRQEFLRLLEEALRQDTPGSSSYYPGSIEQLARFKEHYPQAKVITPEQGKTAHSEFLLIEDVSEGDFAVTHEAFCQVIDEVALDTPVNASQFLEAAVSFSNNKLLGTLCACILIDPETQKRHQDALNDAITDLDYGGIAINTIPLYIWLNPYLTWGGNEEGREFVSGLGNFGNLMGFKNVEKSIIWSSFMSFGHLLNTNKRTWLEFSNQAAEFSTKPTWGKALGLLMVMIKDKFRSKDF